MNEMSERYRELEALGGSLAEDKRLLESDLAAMREEVRRLRESNTDLLNRLAQESETVRQTLEAAISSSVRLCVVAPTVNVHVSNRSVSRYALLTPLNLRIFNQHFCLYATPQRHVQDAVGPTGELHPHLHHEGGPLQVHLPLQTGGRKRRAAGRKSREQRPAGVDPEDALSDAGVHRTAHRGSHE